MLTFYDALAKLQKIPNKNNFIRNFLKIKKQTLSYLQRHQRQGCEEYCHDPETEGDLHLVLQYAVAFEGYLGVTPSGFEEPVRCPVMVV